MITPLDARDAAVLALNNAHAAELSVLTAERFAVLVGRSFLAVGIAPARAFLIAFDQDAAYDSGNFTWFRRRRDRFVYLDRIAVAAEARGAGLARLLYGHLFAVCQERGHERVVCEVNLDPPNRASDALHAALGFVSVGQAVIGGGKTVRYLEKLLDRAAGSTVSG